MDSFVERPLDEYPKVGWVFALIFQNLSCIQSTGYVRYHLKYYSNFADDGNLSLPGHDSWLFKMRYSIRIYIMAHNLWPITYDPWSMLLLPVEYLISKTMPHGCWEFQQTRIVNIISKVNISYQTVSKWVCERFPNPQMIDCCASMVHLWQHSDVVSYTVSEYLCGYCPWDLSAFVWRWYQICIVWVF